MNIRISTRILSLLLVLISSKALIAAPPTHEEVSQVTSFLFVQNAASGTFEDGLLTFHGNSPVIFFSDRPYRISGHTKLQKFIDSWDAGENSFAKNPPNAVLSILGEDVQSFVVILSEPKLNADSVSYKITVEEGTIPASFKDASLFIDNEAWAAVGGLAAGRISARRSQEREAAAYTAGQLSTDQSSAQQDSNTYYQAQAPAASPAPAASSTPEEQLGKLKELLDKGLITQDDYDTKKKEILATL